jgi:hypothetical protein
VSISVPVAETAASPVRRRSSAWAMFWGLLGGAFLGGLVVTTFLGIIDTLTHGSLLITTTPGSALVSLRWPEASDTQWARAFDAAAAVTLVLAASWIARRIRRDGKTVPTWAIVAAMAAIFLSVGSSVAPFGVLVVASIVLPRLPAASPPKRWSWRTRRAAAGVGLAVWLVVIAGGLYAANQHPIASQQNCGGGSVSGTGLAEPTSGVLGGSGTATFAYHVGARVMPSICIENRAPYRSATILGVDQQHLAAGPWQARLVTFAGLPHPSTLGPVTLTPHATRFEWVELRLTGCTPTESGHRYTLSALPLTVRARGVIQVAAVPLTQPIATTCP